VGQKKDVSLSLGRKTMEYVIELVLDLFFEFFVAEVPELITNSEAGKKLPRKARIVLGMISLAVVSALLVAGVVFSVWLITTDSLPGGIAVAAVTLFFALYIAFTVRKCYRKIRQSRS
jgi:hypothetical protein